MRRRKWSPTFRFFVLALTLISIFSVAVTFNMYYSHNQICIVVHTCTYNAPNPIEPATTPVVTYPLLDKEYYGSAYNTTYGRSATLDLHFITQNQDQISGNVVMGPGLCGSGSFVNGSINSNGNVNFTDNSGICGSITFYGSLENGSLGGTYTTSGYQQGTWHTQPV